MKRDLFIRFMLFSLMGGITFICDAALFYGAWRGLGLSAESARVMVLPLSLTISWLLNRTYTFRFALPPDLKEWLRFCLVNGGGAVVNALVFIVLLNIFPHWNWGIVFVLGVLAGLIFNFVGTSAFVFSSRRNRV